jgi:precorrin-6x reductase
MTMPLFLIERNFADAIEMNPEFAADIKRVNDDIGVQWLYSFLSADRKKSYCLHAAPSADAVREASKLLNVPADVIVEVGELRPEMFTPSA